MLALIQTFVMGETTRAAVRVRRAVIDYIVAGICLAIGIGFLIGASYIYVAQRYGSLWASIAFGVGFVAIAAVVLIIHRIAASRQARRRADEARTVQMKTLAAAMAVSTLPSLLKGRGGLIQLLTPALAMAAYAIYRENSDRPLRDDEHVD